MRRVPPSVTTKAAIQALLEGGFEGEDPRSELMQLAMRVILEEASEAKARDIVGRGYYERREEGEAGYRNGHRASRLKTAEGEVRFDVPQLRGVDASGLAELRKQLKGRTSGLEQLAVEMFARGCSTRDIEDAFRGADGASMLSRTAVSEVTESLWKEYEEFATRDLSDVRPLLLFVDGIAERLRPGAKREAVLCAWTITWEGKKVLVHLAPGTKESTECCREFFADMKRRGLADPILVATDGGSGLIRATEECFPKALRQRCLAHKVRNIGSKLPDDSRGTVLQAARAAYQAPSIAMARALRDDLVERYAKEFPSAVTCFEDDFEACIAHLRLPPGFHRIARTTNMLERLFLEERRRVNAAGHLFGERAVLKMMYASLVRGSDRWRGVAISDFERGQLERLADELAGRLREENAPAITSTTNPDRVYSRDRT